jgi:ABC-type dipeptide/oligopeptide/nickel transport system permease component
MLEYCLKRSAHAVFVAFCVTFFTFIFMHLSGDPVGLLLPPGASQEDIISFRRQMGFDEPLYIQYKRFVSNALRGDFGTSYYFRQPVIKLIVQRLPATAELIIASMIFTLIVAIPTGVISAKKRGSLIDNGSMLGAIFGMSIPSYWLGMMLILLFAVELRLLPTSGRGNWLNLILPSISLSAGLWALFARLTRSIMLEIFSQDYITVARSKGLAESAIVLRHALKNGMIPLVTVVGIQLGQLISSAVYVETIFAWPGVGRLIVQAIFARDYPTVQASVLILAIIFVAINFLVDILYLYLDPRIKVK